MRSPSPRKGKGREMERTTPEIDELTADNTAMTDFDSILDRMREWEKVSKRNSQPRSYSLDKKAGTMQTSTSPIEASSGSNNKNNTNDGQLHSTTQDDSAYLDDVDDFGDMYLDDGKNVETPQSSRPRTPWELFSDEVPSANEPRESSINMLHGTSDYGDIEDEPPTSPVSEKSYSKFRQRGADLMTRHMFSGRMNGERPIYIPMYKRDDYGYLLKLRRNNKGKWGYVKLEKLSQNEKQARLKLFEDPKAKRGYPKPENSKRPET